MAVCQGELPFTIDEKGGEKVVGRGVMITRGVVVLPSMPKGEIVDNCYIFLIHFHIEISCQHFLS